MKRIPYKEIFGHNRMSYYPSNKKYVHNSDDAIITEEEQDDSD